ncbi:MAG: WYL domain-containing protein [Anaerolineae bacterium]|nr:WYL domain-containing protein [Anaerolineae bacterium]
MRADRLLSLLMLLQTRGRMSARELAEELEVSQRTILRDVDALSAAGVPIYAEQGRNGGFELLDRYRTTLTGLSEREVRALFMLSIPAPLADLGIRQELKAALLKLTAALPTSRQGDEAQVRQRFYLDSTWWHRDGGALPYLQTIHQAVWEDRELFIKYHPPFALEIERVVAPYSLVAKAGVWYLVCAREGRLRVHRISELREARLTDRHFERSEDFDLESFWQAWCAERAGGFAMFHTTVRVKAGALPDLPYYLGRRATETAARAPAADGAEWVTLTLTFESLFEARARLLGLGGAVAVLSPDALRDTMRDYGEQIAARYSDG